MKKETRGRPKIDKRKYNHRPRKRGPKLKKKTEPEVLYKIIDPLFGQLEIMTSPKADQKGWWENRATVERLISAWKLDPTIIEACGYAGITIDQYKYFIEKYPECSAIKELCNSWPAMKARNTIISDLEQVETAQWYAERKLKSEFSRRVERTGARGGPIQYKLNDEEKKKLDEELDLISQDNSKMKGGDQYGQSN